MSILNQLSLISCSYNTPEVFCTMLKSFRLRHTELGKMNIVIMENSTDNKTQCILDANNIRYIKNPGGTHSRSIDPAFEACTTPYALVVDSDVVFLKNITDLIDSLVKNKVDLAGIECGSRGRYNLKMRIHPWFMFVNLSSIKKHKIKFHDEERIIATNSQGFYGNIPINYVRTDTPMYDVGATFYEDVKNAGLKILNIPAVQSYFMHLEGMSWQRVSGNPIYEHRGNVIWQMTQKLMDAHKVIDIKDFYVGQKLIDSSEQFITETRTAGVC